MSGVEVLPPNWNRSAIRDYYRSADILVLPSRLETWGDVLLEAMAFELPCVGVAGEAMHEIIEHEVSGLITPPEDKDALAAALLCLLRDPALRRRYGEAGRQRVETLFSWDIVSNKIVAQMGNVL